MTTYWDKRFLRHLEGIDLKYIFEVGARYGDESIMLAKVFNTSQIYSFECNPNTIMTCVSKLKDYENITLFCHGLGEKEEVLPFYSYTKDNDGASSLHKRIDFDDTQELTGHVLIRSLESVVREHNIPYIDLLCMDIQGHELSVLKGSAEYLKNVKYIIMEEPKPVINTQFLPEGVHSKYLDTPTSTEIKEFMLKNNFVEIERIDENMIEDNVMYKRISKKRFFNIDLHISVIADIKDIFNRIMPDIEITDWTLSGHSFVFNREQDKVNIINEETWVYMDKDLINKFHKEYDSFLSQFDGFIACHPNSFTMLYEKYNKPIIVINSCRYDIPYCWTKNMDMVNELNNCFKRLQEKKLLYFISNNKADNSYFNLANPSINTHIIPSLCIYTHMKYDTLCENTRFLLYSGNIPYNKYIVDKSTLDKGYKWNSLMNFKGIIHIPYEASTMSIFEQISSGIPLFFPTKRFLYQLWNSGSRKASNYWVNPPEYLISTLDDNFWIERADYYYIEGSYYFDSFDELFGMLENFIDTKYIERVSFIKKRYIDTLNQYKTLLKLL
jgi:FkbM family methyltransferase